MPKRFHSKDQIIQVDSFEQADQLLRQLGDLQLSINAAEASAKDDSDEIKAALAEKTKAAQEETKQLVKSLEAFCIHNKKDFAGEKSRTLNFGILGWRKSTKLVTSEDTLELIKELYSGKQLASLVRTKESVDKDTLSALTDAQLAELEAQRVVKDTFFAEPSLPKSVDYTE